MRVLTPEFRDAFRVVFNVARARGLDVAESLNEHGMLLTGERLDNIRVSTINNLLERLENLPPETVARIVGNNPNPITAAEMYRYTLEWIRVFRDAMRDEGT